MYYILVPMYYTVGVCFCLGKTRICKKVLELEKGTDSFEEDLDVVRVVKELRVMRNFLRNFLT